MKHVAAFITGHSVRGCTGLSREQCDFQRRSAVPEANWLKHNFPWHETFPFPEPFRLLPASWNNVTHYLSSRRPAFREAHRDAVAARFSGYDAVILLAGSCGLELFNQLDLPRDLSQKVHLFAYGPVSRKTPEAATCFLAQGERDWLSRWYHRRVDRRYPCPHMGYLETPETLRLFNEFYRGALGI